MQSYTPSSKSVKNTKNMVFIRTNLFFKNLQFNEQLKKEGENKNSQNPDLNLFLSLQLS